MPIINVYKFLMEKFFDVSQPIEENQKIYEDVSYIKCIYDIIDNNEIQIINYRSDYNVNEDIGKKIKILNGDKKEELIFKKKFDNLGINTIVFIVEEKLTDLSYLFNKCSSLKDVKFISFEMDQVTKMRAMFSECDELEYLDLSDFNTSNVTDMGYMFNQCKNLKEINGINDFNT